MKFSFFVIFTLFSTLSGLEFSATCRDQYGRESIINIAEDDAKFGLIICDMWESHSCKKLASRCLDLAPKINEFAKRLRMKKIPIVHAPSGGVDFYSHLPQRMKMEALRSSFAFQIARQSRPDLDSLMLHPPIAYHVCDLRCQGDVSFSRKIARAIEVAEEDYISDDGDEIFSLFKKKGIQWIFIVGVHSNMCVLGRSFGSIDQIKAGFCPIIVRDLVDVAYTTDFPPHILVEEANSLMTKWFEQKICPTVSKDDF